MASPCPQSAPDTTASWPAEPSLRTSGHAAIRARPRASGFRVDTGSFAPSRHTCQPHADMCRWRRSSTRPNLVLASNRVRKVRRQQAREAVAARHSPSSRVVAIPRDGLPRSSSCGRVVAVTRRGLPAGRAARCPSPLIGRSASRHPGRGEVLVAAAVGEVVEPLAAHELDGGTGTVAGGAVDDVAARLVEGADALIEIGS